MGILAARVRPYALRLKQPWRGASATLTERRGALLCLGSGSMEGWGDCAPLPSSGEEGFAGTLAALDAAADSLDGMAGSEAPDWTRAIENPVVRWSAETALLDLASRREGVTLRASLRRGAADSIAVNAALGALSAGTAERAAAARDQGFRVAKIKVGLSPVADEIAALREVAARTDGGLRLRLDANRAWAAADARRMVDGIADLPIDGLEEPLADPSLAELSRLQRIAPFAVAVDESLFALGPDDLFASRAVRRLVVKPARVGGFAAAMRLAEQATAAAMDIVFTSVIDSCVGVAAAAQLAAAVAPDAVHGLATSSWLAEDVATPLPVVGGRMTLPSGAGLGFAVQRQFAQG